MNVNYHLKLGILILGLLVLAMSWSGVASATPFENNNARDKSDLNADLVVDNADLVIFSTNFLDRFWETVDWCAFYEATVAGTPHNGRATIYFKQHFRMMLAFINAEFNCGSEVNLLELENTPVRLVRMARAPGVNGDFYITDPRVGSVFIYDAGMALKAEIKGLDKPLGIAVDSQGYILVGNNGRDNIEVYNPADGNLLAIFGQGQVLMPTSITVGPDERIYVTDSLSHNVKMFDANFNALGVIGNHGNGEGELDFPIDTEVIATPVDGEMVYEVFIADQGNQRIQIFNREGEALGSIEKGYCHWFRGCDPPTFSRLQALDVDASGRLHALDVFAASVSIIDPISEDYILSYGEYGEEPGFLRVPMDVIAAGSGTTLVIAGDSERIEVYSNP